MIFSSVRNCRSEFICSKIRFFKKESESIVIEKEGPIIKYEDIKDIVNNIKLNWTYLINKEKKQFIESFIDYIKVIKKDNKVLSSIKNINNDDIIKISLKDGEVSSKERKVGE